MIKEIKKSFEASLADVLANDVHSSQKMKSLKKRLKIVSLEDPGNHAYIGFDYLGGRQAYYFRMSAWSEEFLDYIKAINPPYGSNFYTAVNDGCEFHLSMTTLGENRGLYSRTNGQIDLLPMPDTLPNIMKHIATCLNEHYIPRLERFITFSPDLIEDVIKTPRKFNYPIPLIAYVLKKNNLTIAPYQHLIGRKMLKNKAFDKALLGLG